MGTTCCSTPNYTQNNKAVAQCTQRKDHSLKISTKNTEHTIEIASTKAERLVEITFIFESMPVCDYPVMFSESELLCNVVSHFIKHLPKLSDYSFRSIDNADIDQNQTVEEAFKKGNDSYFSEQNIVYVVYDGLEVPSSYLDIIDRYSAGTNLIGCPIPNTTPFELRIFSSKDSSMSRAKISTAEYPVLVYFSEFSAYCNGNNHLFLSGGEDCREELQGLLMENKYLSNLAKIDLRDGTFTKLDPLNIPRFWHSMIYIPSRYVFIIGGNCTKSVEILNTETGEVTEDSILNQFHSEPTLCLVNENYLYCFMGFDYGPSHNYSNIIEKCNLRKRMRKWEIVSPITNDLESCEIQTRFFGITYLDKGSLLLLGGEFQLSSRSQEEVRPVYLYDLNTDTAKELKENAFAADYNSTFSEKFFFPMKTLDSTHSFIMPKQIENKFKVIFVPIQKNIEVKVFEDEVNNSSQLVEQYEQ